MTTHLKTIVFGGASIIALLLVGCGGAIVKRDLDPLALIAEGRFAEARTLVLAKGVNEPEDHAIVALCLVAEKPGYPAGEEAVKVLTEATSSIGTAAAAVDMLELAFSIPQPIELDLSIILSEAALGSVGQGPLAPSTTPAIPVGAASRSLAVAALERVHLALSLSETIIDPGRLLSIWNACFTLSGGSTEAADEVEAWRLFCSIGGLAVIMHNVSPDSDFSSVLLRAAIGVIENNPDIAIAARCDLASPFDNLKSAVSHKRTLLGRLEMAVAAATGCTRGTYAPEVR
ncbi:MAG: hypothetical protein GY847_13045 [Proteobacteria bacterium]|nr:hypothetical protein [Pseudomonadota bacterium]